MHAVHRSMTCQLTWLSVQTLLRCGVSVAPAVQQRSQDLAVVPAAGRLAPDSNPRSWRGHSHVGRGLWCWWAREPRPCQPFAVHPLWLHPEPCFSVMPEPRCCRASHNFSWLLQHSEFVGRSLPGHLCSFCKNRMLPQTVHPERADSHPPFPVPQPLARRPEQPPPPHLYRASSWPLRQARQKWSPCSQRPGPRISQLWQARSQAAQPCPWCVQPAALRLPLRPGTSATAEELLPARRQQHFPLHQ
mmetsp:Transcript_102699/g.178465  ORF Transcript_102699/g.178465 Transcript_102699/m.178465 type:complete len:246 (-) Transcript_102699:71-808(-)